MSKLVIVLHISMLALLLTFIISFIVVSFFGHLVHWSLHQPWMGSVYNAHMTHHLKLYPPTDYTSDIYRHAGNDSTPKHFILIASPLIVGPILLTVFGILPLPMLLIILGMEAAMGFTHDYVHDAFHINNHWMTRLPIFNKFFAKWNKSHYLHHVDMSKNYGIFIFWWDRLFKTLKTE